jgi:hypothetical protein
MSPAKHRLFLAAPDTSATGRAGFRADILHQVAPALAEAVPGLAALSVCLVDATPAEPPWQRAEEPAAPDTPAFDAVLDLRGPATALAAALAQLAPLLAHAHVSARVEECVEKDDLPRLPGRVPGTKFLSLMRFHADLPEGAARRMWAHHAPLALAVHAGMARYVRDWVVALSPGALPVPRFHGIAELHFPSSEAMMTRWFDSEAGRAAIRQDVGHFLERATRLYTTEHVLRAG